MSEKELVEIIREWKWSWMNQKQNSEQDFQNYYRRASGIDANMIYSLARKIIKAMDKATKETE